MHLLVCLGDKAVIHALRVRPSNQRFLAALLATGAVSDGDEAHRGQTGRAEDTQVRSETGGHSLEDLRSPQRAEDLAGGTGLRRQTRGLMACAREINSIIRKPGNIGPGLTGGLAPSDSEPAPSPRLWIFPWSAASRRIGFNLTRTSQTPHQNRTFLLFPEILQPCPVQGPLDTG